MLKQKAGVVTYRTAQMDISSVVPCLPSVGHYKLIQALISEHQILRSSSISFSKNLPLLFSPHTMYLNVVFQTLECSRQLLIQLLLFPLSRPPATKGRKKLQGHPTCTKSINRFHTSNRACAREDYKITRKTSMFETTKRKQTNQRKVKHYSTPLKIQYIQYLHL